MSAFESDDHSFSALLLVSPILVQTDRGEVEAKAGEYLVVTAAGRQMVMSGDELRAHMQEPHGEPVAPVEEVPRVQPKKGSILGRLRRGKAPDRVVVSVAEEGFKEVLQPDPEPVDEEPAAPVEEVPAVGPEKKGMFSSLLGARGLGGKLERLAGKPGRLGGKPDDVREFPVPGEESAFAWGVDSELEPAGVEAVVAEPLPELELELEEQEDVEDVLEDLMVRPEVTPRVPAIADPPVPVSESLVDLSTIKTNLLGSFLGKTKPATSVRKPFAQKGMTKRPDPEICHNLPPVPVQGDPKEWDPFMPLSDEANRDLARLERAALANIEPPAEPKGKGGLFGVLGKAPAGKKGKKKKMVLPFQKKAAAVLVEPKKEKYKWVPIDWI